MVDEHIARIQTTDMGAQCGFCPGRSFRRSRLQVKDLGALLMLHYPVRCLQCSPRQPVPVQVARRAVSSSVRQVKNRERNGSSWNGWNAEDQAKTLPRQQIGPAAVRLPVREPMVLPDLRGIQLTHLTNLPSGSEQTKAG